MSELFQDPCLEVVEKWALPENAAGQTHTVRIAKVMSIGFNPRNASTYVGINFVPRPSSGPLGVTTVWEERGVDLARFAMAHGKKLLVLYRGTDPSYRWSDVIELDVLDY